MLTFKSKNGNCMQIYNLQLRVNLSAKKSLLHHDTHDSSLKYTSVLLPLQLILIKYNFHIEVYKLISCNVIPDLFDYWALHKDRDWGNVSSRNIRNYERISQFGWDLDWKFIPIAASIVHTCKYVAIKSHSSFHCA